jgi:hypothetical protein
MAILRVFILSSRRLAFSRDRVCFMSERTHGLPCSHDIGMTYISGSARRKGQTSFRRTLIAEDLAFK